MLVLERPFKATTPEIREVTNKSNETKEGFVKRSKSDRKEGCTGSVLSSFLKHQSALRGYISRFVKRNQDIDDVAQEAFLRAYKAEQKRIIDQPKSFLFRIAHNVAISELTKKSSQIIDYIEDIDNSGVIWGGSTAEDEAIAKQSLDMHYKAVTKLPDQCRRVYLMRKVHGMRYKEIAESLGIAVSTVEKHMAKGVRLSARYLDELEGETHDEHEKHVLKNIKGEK